MLASMGNTHSGGVGAFARFRAQPQPLSTTLKMKSIVRHVDEIINDYNETSQALFRRYGTANPITGMYDFGEDADKVKTQHDELLAADVDIPGDRIKISQLFSSMAISEDDLTALEWLIDDGQPKAEKAQPQEPAEEEDPLELDDQAQTAKA